jgi:hypothetical protein
MRVSFGFLRLLAGRLLGTSDSPVDVAERLGYRDSGEVEWEDALLDVGVERCPVCDCWCECSELVDEDGDERPCCD